jgi:hypothetical protein
VGGGGGSTAQDLQRAQVSDEKQFDDMLFDTCWSVCHIKQYYILSVEFY